MTDDDTFRSFGGGCGLLEEVGGVSFWVVVAMLSRYLFLTGRIEACVNDHMTETANKITLSILNSNDLSRLNA